MIKLLSFSLILISLATFGSCRRQDAGVVTVALPEKFTTFDTLTTIKNDSSAERVRSLMFNSLVKKNEAFDYVGDLAKNIATSDDGLTVTFTLQDGVKFHNGKELTSADVKYTLDKLFESKGFKSAPFFDSVPDEKAPADGKTAKMKSVPQITSIEVPDAKTVVIKVTRPALKNQLLSNLVAIPIIAEGTAEQQKDSPVGTGPFKFVSYDSSQGIVDLAANADYWAGAPKVQKLRLKTVTDANSLQAELQTGRVDIAPNPNNIAPDTIKALAASANLKVVQSEGSNIQYLVLNTQSAPLNNVKVRQAIGYAIDRKKIVADLFFDQAKVADSILPTQSWAYTPGTVYNYDPDKAKALLQEAGYKNEPIVFKFGSGILAVNQYSQVIQSALTSVGLNVQIETLEANTARDQVSQGQYQLYTGVWIGGNQDPIFLRDLFTTSKIPGPTASCCNRSRYSNPQVDSTIDAALNSVDREKAKAGYIQAWSMISNDMPMLPLWYPANIVVVNKRIDNVNISPSGDWTFLKDVTVNN